eukprot:scaffold107130_cov17-Tisochrysis_lutea.AAC.4
MSKCCQGFSIHVGLKAWLGGKDRVDIELSVGVQDCQVTMKRTQKLGNKEGVAGETFCTTHVSEMH